MDALDKAGHSMSTAVNADLIIALRQACDERNQAQHDAVRMLRALRRITHHPMADDDDDDELNNAQELLCEMEARYWVLDLTTDTHPQAHNG